MTRPRSPAAAVLVLSGSFLQEGVGLNLYKLRTIVLESMSKTSLSAIYVVRLHRALYDTLSERASEYGMSRADIVRLALREYLARPREADNV